MPKINKDIQQSFVNQGKMEDEVGLIGEGMKALVEENQGIFKFIQERDAETMKKITEFQQEMKETLRKIRETQHELMKLVINQKKQSNHPINCIKKIIVILLDMLFVVVTCHQCN